MHKYLPSKKFVLFLFTVVLILGGIWMFSFFTNKEKITMTPVTESGTTLREIMTADSDNDSLKDWEEALWRTNPKLADTDGDGTDDYTEIKLNRDPLKANTAGKNKEPNDKIEEKILEAREKAQSTTTPLTTTEKMSRELFTQYLNAKKVNSTLSETEMQVITKNILALLPTIYFNLYTEKDLTISSKSDNETLRIYTNRIAEIILNNIKIETENIDAIIATASENTAEDKFAEQTKEIFQRFQPLLDKNQKTVSDLQQMSVPAVVTTEHLNLLNAFEEIVQSLDLMQKSSNDAVILILIKNNYSQSTQKLVDSILELTKKLSSLKVSFASENDYGYKFFNVIIMKE